MKKHFTMHRIAAAVTAGVLAGQTTSAHAVNFTDVSHNIVDSSSGIPQMISTVAYIGGIGLGVAGIFKLKQHVDNPGQVALKDGLVRLGAGGGLLALPFLTEAMTGNIAAGSQGNTGFQQVDTFGSISSGG